MAGQSAPATPARACLAAQPVPARVPGLAPRLPLPRARADAAPPWLPAPQLGWASANQTLHDTALRFGVQTLLSVPPSFASNGSFTLFKLASQPGAQRLFVSARVNTYPYDTPFARSQDGKPFLLFHTYNGTATAAYQRTVLLATVPLGGSYTDPASGLVFSFADWDAADGASATVCRRRAAFETVCGDGLVSLGPGESGVGGAAGLQEKRKEMKRKGLQEKAGWEALQDLEAA